MIDIELTHSDPATPPGENSRFVREQQQKQDWDAIDWSMTWWDINKCQDWLFLTTVLEATGKRFELHGLNQATPVESLSERVDAKIEPVKI